MAKKKVQINTNRGRAETHQDDSIYDNPIELPQDFGVIPSAGIVKRDDGSLEVSNVRIHRIGLEFVGEVSEDEYEIFGQTLLQIDTAYQWIVGDYLAYGVDNNYGMAKEFADKLGRSEGTVNNWTSICRQVTFSRRRENLSFKHHVEVASLPSDQQEYWLQQAEIGNGKEGDEHKVWSAKRLRQEIAIAQGENLPESENKPRYEKMQEKMYQDVSLAVARFRKSNTVEDRLGWKRYIEHSIEVFQQALDEIENE